ncbi:unnamed protein product [Kuraishia capsulata CBS 1993]|uniref:Amino acid transporter transmembrane domain-containing protein n=1 Tax=Kuraishia capsulata CBS 1993 TaxID=1382522 RepID=W6MWT4_9ASCO|nr:uncharacterized protein KUCA_T00003814001 [Kuraishia capsulata CBS 1993]CDK27835.1 unnamed protein product [Kuraishia capsulata CBS 1993]
MISEGRTGEASARSAITNLMNTIMGAGMLAMPYGIKANGMVLGVFVIAFSAFCSGFGLYLQGVCSRYVPPGQASFFSLSQLTYPQLGVVFDLAIAVKCFGVGISYLVVIGDLMPKITESLLNETYLESHSLFLNRNFWISVFMVVVVPLSFLRKLDSLKYASMVALSSVAYLVVLVVVHFASGDVTEKGPVRYFEPKGIISMLSCFPIFVFSYTCHQNMFSLVNELKDKSASNINKVIQTGIGSAMVLYILVGVTGYSTFGDNVGGNIIVMYPHSVSSTIGRIAIVILVTLSYPLQCHPCRASTNHVLHYFQKSKAGESLSRSWSRSTGSSATNHVQETRALIFAADEDEDAEEGASGSAAVSLGTAKFVVITTIILIGSYLVAMTVSSLEHILAFVGSTGSTSISFILPGIFGYKLLGEENRWLKRAALALSIWGVVVMLLCLSATLFLGAKH